MLEPLDFDGPRRLPHGHGGCLGFSLQARMICEVSAGCAANRNVRVWDGDEENPSTIRLDQLAKQDTFAYARF